MPGPSLHRVVVLLVATLAAGPASATNAVANATDPFFGEALFHAHQGQFFEAIERLDAEMAQHRGVDEPQLDSLYAVIDQAEFSVGDFELNYRMHHKAGRAVEAVLQADVADPIRNDATYRLARIQLHKGEPAEALVSLDGIHGEVPASIRNDIELLRANTLMSLGRPAEAVEVLRRIQGSEPLGGFSAYNLGVALLQNDQVEDGVRQLDRAGRMSGDLRETLAIRDKANLVLGNMLLESSQFEWAQRALDRVRLEGPFSNRALLGAGWADASAEQYDRALVPWSILSERDTTDASVQEVLLALPYAYSKLAVHGRAAVLYERAVATFENELMKIDSSIESIRNGQFLDALVREEIRQDTDWVIRLRNLPDAPETFYLIDLMASHDFQTALQNYLDLEDLRKKLVAWGRSLDAFEDMTRIRRSYYEPLLPGIDRQFRQLDAQMRLRLEQRRHLENRLQQMLTAPRPDLLATAGEQALALRLDQLEAGLAESGDADRDENLRRIARLRGVLQWQLQTAYHQRLTDTHAHLVELTADVERLVERYDSFVRTRQAAVHSYAGYQPKIDDLRPRIARSLERIDETMKRQGSVLESVALRELGTRRARLADYQNKARFAFAESYDRAVKAQAQVR